jgi:hypothetical protein
MPGDMVDFDVARSIGAELPHVAVGRGGRMALRLKGQILACEAIHKSAEPGTLMVRIGSERRDVLLAETPGAFYLTRHYEPHQVVLVRLSQITPADLRGVLKDAWEFVLSGVA